MDISKFILYFSIIIWLLPPLKQFRGKFFYYFLLQALSDPVVLILFSFGIYGLPLYLAKDLLQIFLLKKSANTRLKFYYLTPCLIFVTFLAYKIPYLVLCLIIALAHIVILYIILRMSIDEIIEIKRIKIFYVLIMLYELSVVMKYIFHITDFHTGIIYYYLTTAFEIFICVFFLFIREDNSRIAVLIKERA